MKDVSVTNFGFLIAYLIPGFTVLWGLSYHSETVTTWLGTAQPNAPTVGGFLYLTLASVAAGLTASTVRWAVIDTVHHWTGVQRSAWDFTRLQKNVAAFNLLGENHYRYYQFYGNMLVAVMFTYAARRVSVGLWSVPPGWYDAGFVLLLAVFLAGSRDTLSKYYERIDQLLSSEDSAEAIAEQSRSMHHLSEHSRITRSIKEGRNSVTLLNQSQLAPGASPGSQDSVRHHATACSAESPEPRTTSARSQCSPGLFQARSH